MLPEALVILACLEGKGCTETSQHYYNTHPEIKIVVENGKKTIERYTGETFIQITGPLIFAAAGGTGTIRLSKHFSLQVNRESGIIGFSKEF